MTTLHVYVHGEPMYVRTDLSQASSPVQVKYARADDWESTPYQCADARHRNDGLARLAAVIAENPCGDLQWKELDDEVSLQDLAEDFGRAMARDDAPDWRVIMPKDASEKLESALEEHGYNPQSGDWNAATSWVKAAYKAAIVAE